MQIDLHTHSTASDGNLSPAALAAYAKDAGIEAFALTDHDTIEGLDEASRAAEYAGIKFVRGVELEIDWPETRADGAKGSAKSGGGAANLQIEKREFHLLGLFLEEISPKLKRILHELRQRRENRNKIIINKMNGLKLGGDGEVRLEDIRPGAQGGYAAYIGRPHFASYLINKKIVKNHEEAFRKYLTKGHPLYEPKGGIKLRRAVSAIKESGGLAIVAHPTSLYISWGRLPAAFASFKKTGLDGIEAYHPIASKHESERLCALANEFDFYISAGSDFHGGRRDREIGMLALDTKITSELVKLPCEINKSYFQEPQV